MSKRKIVGWCILSSPFITISVAMSIRFYWWSGPAFLASLAAVIALLAYATMLIFFDRWR